MRAIHPNDITETLATNGITVIGTLYTDESGWTTLDHVGPDYGLILDSEGYGLLLDSEEWSPFVMLIEEMNRSVIAESKEKSDE